MTGRSLQLLTVLLLLSCPAPGSGQESEPRKTFFLPKSPTAAAYVLGRLSNQELIAAPRSEFVYVALLQRAGLERKYRVEAIEGLAKIRDTDPLTELLAGLRELDKKGATSEGVLRELSPLLVQTKRAELAAKRAALVELVHGAQLALTRQIGYAGLVTADGAVELTWNTAATNAQHLVDLLRAVPLLRDPGLRAAFHPKVESLVQRAEPPEVRRAAIMALPALPGRDVETFNLLAALVRSGAERATAIASLQQLPRPSWPVAAAEPLLENLLPYLEGVPASERTTPEVTSAFQFASELTALLPPDKAAAYSKKLRAFGVSAFVLRTVPEQMLFDQALLVMEAGKPAEIVLINDDAMPHNLVITAPGALEEIGNAAERMPATPDGVGRLYVPDSPLVLHATKLVESGEQARLSFTAPGTPGEYPFVCTYPGHWRRMNGTIAVVPDVEAYLASHPAPQRKVTEWKIADLAPALEKLATGRNLARGKDLFTQLACASCHQLGGAGVSFGPELTAVFPQYQNDPREVLRHILEPSLVISNRYQAYTFELQNGDEVSGIIVEDDGATLTVQAGAAAALIQSIRRSDVKSQQVQRSSLMPTGLLNQLSAEEIMDLLAFLKSGGTLTAHGHSH